MFVTQLEGSVGILSHIQGVYQRRRLPPAAQPLVRHSSKHDGQLWVSPHLSQRQRLVCRGTARLRQVLALSAHLCVVRDFGFAALGLFFPHTRARTHLEPAPWKKNPDLHLSSDQIICIFLMETVKKKNKKNHLAFCSHAVRVDVVALLSRLCGPLQKDHER